MKNIISMQRLTDRLNVLKMGFVHLFPEAASSSENIVLLSHYNLRWHRIMCLIPNLIRERSL